MTSREVLIASGVRNLQNYGYPHCDSTSILTDEIYRAFFLSMLQDYFGHKEVGAAARKLAEEIEGRSVDAPPAKPRSTRAKKGSP